MQLVEFISQKITSASANFENVAAAWQDARKRKNRYFLVISELYFFMHALSENIFSYCNVHQSTPNFR